MTVSDRLRHAFESGEVSVPADGIPTLRVPLASVGSCTLLVANGIARLLVIVRFSTTGAAVVGAVECVAVAVAVAVTVGVTPSDPQAASTSKLLTINAAPMAFLMTPPRKQQQDYPMGRWVERQLPSDSSDDNPMDRTAHPTKRLAFVVPY